MITLNTLILASSLFPQALTLELTSHKYSKEAQIFKDSIPGASPKCPRPRGGPRDQGEVFWP